MTHELDSIFVQANFMLLNYPHLKSMLLYGYRLSFS